MRHSAKERTLWIEAETSVRACARPLDFPVEGLALNP